MAKSIMNINIQAMIITPAPSCPTPPPARYYCNANWPDKYTARILCLATYTHVVVGNNSRHPSVDIPTFAPRTAWLWGTPGPITLIHRRRDGDPKLKQQEPLFDRKLAWDMAYESTVYWSDCTCIFFAFSIQGISILDISSNVDLKMEIDVNSR